MPGRLLVVMSPLARNALHESLEKIGTEPLYAASAAEAERLLAAKPEIEVVVVDQELVDGSWQDVAGAIASRQPSASLLVCTKHVGDIDILAASRRVHIPDVLIKPYNVALVRERILNALRFDDRRPLEGASIPSHPATTE